MVLEDVEVRREFMMEELMDGSYWWFGLSTGSGARFDGLTLVEIRPGVNAKEPTICAKIAVRNYQLSAVSFQAGLLSRIQCRGGACSALVGGIPFAGRSELRPYR
jgi:hypothetical protein